MIRAEIFRYVTVNFLQNHNVLICIIYVYWRNIKMSDLNKKFNKWMDKLLDLGKRNKLLNYIETKRGTLSFTTPSIFELWNILVINRKSLKFPYVDEDSEESNDSLIEQHINSHCKNKNSPEITTTKTIKEQSQTLRELRIKSKQFIEEHGINVLYLSFGFLKWTEDSKSDTTFESPLILVPVSLTCESISSPFVLELHDDEIVLNPTIAYKLEHDWGIKLPEYNDEEDLDKFLRDVEFAIKNKKWSVEKKVSLGMLSFLKNNMYKDLEKHKEAILSNPIIKAISGDCDTLQNYEGLSEIKDFDFDNKINPKDVFQVLDADSSQQDAILCAKKGISFVLQGPPGTGKSQTITNIIAECLAENKKVLFVSEKVAALDVVYNRLKDVNLDVFCLVLHSHKANKKQIIDQLRKVWDLAGKKDSKDDELQELDELLKYRNNLNSYDEQLHKVITPLNMSIFDVNGQIATISNYKDIKFSIPNIKNTTQKEFKEYISILERLKNSVYLMDADYHISPWKGASVKSLSNELRLNITSELSNLKDITNKVSDIINNIKNSLGLEIGDSYSSAKTILNILKSIHEFKPFSKYWIINEDWEAIYAEIKDNDEIKSEFECKRNIVLDCILEINNYNLQFNADSNFSSTDEIGKLILLIKNRIHDNVLYNKWNSETQFDDFKLQYSSLKENMRKYLAVEKKLDEEYEKEFINFPCDELFFRFSSLRSVNFIKKFFIKLFDNQYKIDKNSILKYKKLHTKRFSDEDILNVLSKLRCYNELKSKLDNNTASLKPLLPNICINENIDFNKIDNCVTEYELLVKLQSLLEDLEEVVHKKEEKDEFSKKCFENLYLGLDTPWGDIKTSLNWTNSFKKIIGDNIKNNDQFINKLHDDILFVKECSNFESELQEVLTKAKDNYEFCSNLFEDKNIFNEVSFNELTDRLEYCIQNMKLLEEWVDFCKIKTESVAKNLAEYVKIIEEQSISKEEIVPIFKKRFYLLWLDNVLPQNKAVQEFRGDVQEDYIKKFKKFDRKQLSIAKFRIEHELINSLSSHNNMFGEQAILMKELGKKKNIMPIRKLFMQIPNLITKLKPCLMMSPLSVSMFLESDDCKFDIVIFDEASQVRTENAIGAIFRGKQVIIVGDNKQLPPTNFFTSSDSDNDYDSKDEDCDNYEYESILEESALLPQRTLLWHYRSKHEHLIAFSNAKIYNKQLITFPSNIDKAPNVGVEFKYVKDGLFDKNGKNGNPVEAKHIADMVFEHFNKFPNRSLGVITFGEVQQRAIETALRKKRLENQSFEALMNEDKKEPFFIKSLENVQGDERDTIILSIGYSKDSNGIIKMNFGPLGKSGGERRLNVAITRAKFNVKVVSSIMPTDIDLDKLTMEGPKLLRYYMEFAKDGLQKLTNEITENADVVSLESPFEESVYNYLIEKGYQVATQVGCSGYRIDMAIKHPSLSGIFVLGIECDGATYHSARTARERDRLRQDILENIGWKIYRIWSTDWIKDQYTEKKNLIEAIDKALKNYTEDDQMLKENDIEDEVSNTPLEDDIVDEEIIEESENENSSMGFTEISEISINDGESNEDFLKRIIETSYPIHLDEICKKFVILEGRKKITNVFRKDIQNYLRKISSFYTQKKKFYFTKSIDLSDIKNMPVRKAGQRTINFICNEELAAGMYHVLINCIGGIEKDSLINEATKSFGFKRQGDKITKAMESAYKLLIELHIIEESNGKTKLI